MRGGTPVSTTEVAGVAVNNDMPSTGESLGTTAPAPVGADTAKATVSCAGLPPRRRSPRKQSTDIPNAPSVTRSSRDESGYVPASTLFPPPAKSNMTEKPEDRSTTDACVKPGTSDAADPTPRPCFFLEPDTGRPPHARTSRPHPTRARALANPASTRPAVRESKTPGKPHTPSSIFPVAARVSRGKSDLTEELATLPSSPAVSVTRSRTTPPPTPDFAGVQELATAARGSPVAVEHHHYLLRSAPHHPSLRPRRRPTEEPPPPDYRRRFFLCFGLSGVRCELLSGV
ncbi:mucin-2-like [Triticum aestivum]|uniref:mucin-2-like n=1 Tax=Triticum aestivum TaxID=4565 RepID=UPI001D005AF0|nr:mucin-2-like [Triticum aestivum]